MDAFSHIIESYVSKKATTITRVISIGLLSCIRNALERAIIQKELKSLETLQCIAFSARLLYPRTGLTIAHALSHPLGAFTNMHHGIAVLVFLKITQSLTNQGVLDLSKILNWLCDRKRMIRVDLNGLTMYLNYLISNQ
jgi:alcohol dehydrogenase class IV